MVEKPYNWSEGAKLEEHSRRKLKILREYFFEYLRVRCQVPKQERFRLAIIDGFSGGGRYECQTAGSPLIFLEELKHAVNAFNIQRSAQGFGLIEIECLLVLNDANPVAIEQLKRNTAPILAEIIQNEPKLHIKIEYLNEKFESAYLKMTQFIRQGRYKNVLFNLDQCGHSHIHHSTLVDIMSSYQSVEIFYTFAIQSLISFLQQTNPDLLEKQISYLGIKASNLINIDNIVSKNTWLGSAEKIVFESFRTCSRYTSPFSINNPDGWRYWFIHFANNYRARQVYNNKLHENSSAQAHFGRSGLNMLSYDPRDEGALYLFDQNGRETAKSQLTDDVPRLLSDFGDVIGISDFYETIYNSTPAHADDIHQAIIENRDIEVITPGGGERRKANKIDIRDVMKLKRQKSFFSHIFIN
jgi:three-Cys-motif partner protein